MGRCFTQVFAKSVKASRFIGSALAEKPLRTKQGHGVSVEAGRSSMFFVVGRGKEVGSGSVHAKHNNNDNMVTQVTLLVASARPKNNSQGHTH